jgi:hypothetical protein
MTTTSERKKFDHLLEVNLTSEELKEKLLAHVAIEREIDDVKARKARAMNEFTKELREKNEVRATLMQVIATEKEKRTVEVYHERDDRRGMMRTLRFDNHELIDERALTMEEREEGKQPELPFVPGATPTTEPPIDENQESEDTDGDAGLDGTLDRFEAQNGTSSEPDDEDDDDEGDDE